MEMYLEICKSTVLRVSQRILLWGYGIAKESYAVLSNPDELCMIQQQKEGEGNGGNDRPSHPIQMY